MPRRRIHAHAPQAAHNESAGLTQSLEPLLAQTTPTSDSPTREDVAARAYQIYLDRGGQEGHAVEDWLEAERVLTSHSNGNGRHAG